MLCVGQYIADRYEILREIGRGGTSTVYLVADNHLNKNFAIKEIRKSDFANSSAVAGSLIQEANIMNKLNHQLLPRIIDVLDRDSYVYVVMDYIQGQTLNQVMKQHKKIPEAFVIHWFKQLCEVLTYLHTANPPIIFRDLKPSNIILTKDGSIRLIDFGAAREFKRSVESKAADNWGTRGYAAPEQIMMNGVVDARSDIYSLGVTMHYLLTGSDPRDAANRLKPIRYYDPGLSPSLERILIKCTQFSPKDRYQNCRELFFDLSKISDKYTAQEKRKKSRSLAITSVVISAVVFIMTLLFFLVGMTENQRLQMSLPAHSIRTILEILRYDLRIGSLLFLQNIT